jgi:hypothetical protein
MTEQSLWFWWRQRRLWHREIERRFGRLARSRVQELSDFAFSYYVAYLSAGEDHGEARRGGLLSFQHGSGTT